MEMSLIDAEKDHWLSFPGMVGFHKIKEMRLEITIGISPIFSSLSGFVEFIIFSISSHLTILSYPLTRKAFVLDIFLS